MINDAGLVLAANALDTNITHMQFHSAAPTAGVGSEIGSRVAVNGSVDGDGDITWTNVAGSSLGASVAVWGVSYWSQASSGTCYGQTARTSGDTNANSAGEYTFTSITETSSAT